MKEKEFNLLEEPWILALNRDCETEELSLLEVFERAHELTALTGELPTQDAAILRLLLAVLYATFTRVDEKGNQSSLNLPEDALSRWERLWNLGRFPIDPIKRRLTYYDERFYLFHPERPFYQVAGLRSRRDEAPKPASQLIMDVPSRDERQFLTNRRGESAQRLSYAEAARWLVCLQAWDYAGKKQSIVGGAENGGGAGWLGKLGVVYIGRKNLFEQLLLNFVLLKGDGALLPYGIPAWEEAEPPTAAKRDRIPKGYCELLTWQSRRVSLKRQERKVEGVIRSYGDVFEKENTFLEQMTGWHLSSARTSSGSSTKFIPNKHKTNRSVWRDLGAILPSKNIADEENKIPGSVQWLKHLNSKEIGQVQINAVGVELGTMDAIVNELIDDKVSINADFFTKLGKDWADRIVDLLAVTDECVKQLGYLAANIAEASGDKGSGKDGRKNAAMEEAYFRLDNPFRIWLAAIDPNSSDKDAKEKYWKTQVRRIVLELAAELVEEAGDQAFVGRVVKRKNKEWIVNSPNAYTVFRAAVNKTLTKH
jgi:CRISPR system Cascade subunit CasA